MFRLFVLLLPSFLLACAKEAPPVTHSATTVSAPNHFMADPELAKTQTQECLMRIEHAKAEGKYEIMNEVMHNASCKAASEAHAEHVNKGDIEPISKDDLKGHDHHHHHH